MFERKYLPATSDIQIRSIISTSTVAEYYRLCELLGRHIKYKVKGNQYRKEVARILERQRNDSEIYKYINSLSKKVNTSYHPDEESSYVGKNYVNIIKNGIPTKITNYLDVGCGTGVKTKIIGTGLELKSDQIYGVDVREWSVLKEDRAPDGIIFKFIDDGILPFQTEFFDLISTFMVLHHIEPKLRSVILSEIYRCLKPGGYFIIREHNAEDAIDCMMCDVEHMLYDYEKIPNFKPNEQSITYFKDIQQWTDEMKSHNFESVNWEIDWSPKHTINPTKPYHHIFKKSTIS